MFKDYVKKIESANLYDLVQKTPINFASSLSEKLENRIYIKREDLQPVFSFKIRGAYNKLKNLSKLELDRGVIAASAGNHAQGVALAAHTLDVKAVIVMPVTTPEIKVQAVGARATVILHGDTYDEAYSHAIEISKTRKMTFIHPFDDEDVIVGQGTVGYEIFTQVQGAIDYIFIPVGGGGLCAGVAAYIKSLSPETKIIAVETLDAACLNSALMEGKPVKLKSVGLFADGTAVAEIGGKTFSILKELVDDVVLVSTDEICAAIKDIYNEVRAICEPSGAMSLAGLKKFVSQNAISESSLITIQCGANIDFDRLRYISERTEVGEKKEAILAVTLREEIGSFHKFCGALNGRVISEFNYRYSGENNAQVFVGVKVISDGDRERLIAYLTGLDYRVKDLTESEMAKSHVRYMVGGKAPSLTEEQIFRVQFPEKPGALHTFLTHLGGQFNITMFHYRNHGSAFGKVLVGFQCSDSDCNLIKKILDELNYPCQVETHSEAYKFFL